LTDITEFYKVDKMPHLVKSIS